MLPPPFGFILMHTPQVFEEMRRGVGGLQRQDLAFSLRLVGVPISDRQAQRLLPALYGETQ